MAVPAGQQGPSLFGPEAALPGAAPRVSGWASFSIGSDSNPTLLSEDFIDAGIRARLAILRGGSLSLGQETRLRLDQQRIDAATGRSQSTLSLLLGRLELALGRLFQGELTIETPTTTLGLRGTLVRILVDADGRTVVAVLEGVAQVTSRAGGTVNVQPGFFSVVDPGAPPTPAAPFDLRGAGLSAGTRGPDFVVPGEDVLVDSPLRTGQLGTAGLTGLG